MINKDCIFKYCCLAIAALFVLGACSLYLAFVVEFFIKGYTLQCHEKIDNYIINSRSCVNLTESVQCHGKTTTSYIEGSAYLEGCDMENIVYTNYTTTCLNLCITPLNDPIIMKTTYITKTSYDILARIMAYIFVAVPCVGVLIGVIIYCGAYGWPCS